MHLYATQLAGSRGNERMLKKTMLVLLSLIVLAGCASTTTFTLSGGDTIRARKVVEETPSTYVIEEEGTGRRTVIPKSAVVSVTGKHK